MNLLPNLKVEAVYALLKKLDQNVFPITGTDSSSKSNIFPYEDVLPNFEIEGAMFAC